MIFDGSTTQRSYLIPKSAVSIRLFYSLVGYQKWETFLYRNGGFFYEDFSYLNDFYTRLSRAARRNKQQMEVFVFSNKELRKEIRHSTFTQISETSFTETLAQIKEYRDSIRADYKDKGSFANRKHTIIVLDLSKDSNKDLQNPDIRGLLLNLLENSENDRLYIFLAMKNSRYLATQLTSALDWAVFLEEPNVKVAEERYELPQSVYDETRRVAGLLFKQDQPELAVVHDLKRRDSDWNEKYKDYEQQEKSAFTEMIESIIPK